MTTKLTPGPSVPAGRVRFDDVPSPCVGVCRLAPTDNGPICRGCFRYATEIAKWTRFSGEEKRKCVGQIAERQARYNFDNVT